jgi:hypothetical protein
MARKSRVHKPRAKGVKEVEDITWEVDGELLHASSGWTEWGGELILAIGETSGGAPFGLSLQDYQAILAREAERGKRMEEMRKSTWEHLTVDLDGVMEALDSHDPDLIWVLDLESGEVVCFAEEERREDPEEPWEDPDRYLGIHPIESHERFDFMADFVDDLPAGKPRAALEPCLRRRHPFRAFRDTLQEYPQVREAWFKYHDGCIRSLAMAWLEENLKGARVRTT